MRSQKITATKMQGYLTACNESGCAVQRAEIWPEGRLILTFLNTGADIIEIQDEWEKAIG